MTPAEYNRKLPIPGEYARSWRLLNTLPPEQQVKVPGWIVGLPDYSDLACSVGKVLGYLHRSLDLRINARAGFEPREPREETHRLRRDSDRVRDILTRRLRVYQFETRAAKRRFSHLLASYSDD